MGAGVSLKNITISYARHPAVHHVSGTFLPGSLTAVAGPNGAGKSTLLKAIAGVLSPEEGSINVTGSPLVSMAYLPQTTHYEKGFPLNVLQLVCTGAWHRIGSFAAITPELREKATQALTVVGMEHTATRSLESLSTGQFQRVLFARLMMQDADLILLDEPFNALDAATTRHLLSVIAGWHKEGRTVICVLHDIMQIRDHFPECLLLARECIAWGPTADILRAHPLFDARFFPHSHNEPQPEICAQSV